MNSTNPEGDLKSAWQSQGGALPPINTRYFQHRLDDHARRTRARERLEYVGAAVLVGACLWFIVMTSDMWVRAIAAFLIAGIAWHAYQWRARMSTRWLRADQAAADSLTFLRGELARQRDAHAGMWRWSYPAMLPGVVLTIVWAFLIDVRPERVPRASWLAVGILAWLLAMIWHERREAMKHQRELDALDSLTH